MPTTASLFTYKSSVTLLIAVSALILILFVRALCVQHVHDGLTLLVHAIPLTLSPTETQTPNPNPNRPGLAHTTSDVISYYFSGPVCTELTQRVPRGERRGGGASGRGSRGRLPQDVSVATHAISYGERTNETCSSFPCSFLRRDVSVVRPAVSRVYGSRASQTTKCVSRGVSWL